MCYEYYPMTHISIGEKWRRMLTQLNEKQRRYYAAFEAKAIGFGGVSLFAYETGMSRDTIHIGIREIESGTMLEGERVRHAGGGRKGVLEKDPSIADDLDEIAEPKGSPDSPLKWTTKSFGNVREALSGMGHHIGMTTVRNVLKACQYSLQADRKNIEGGSKDPDRDRQFQHINEETKEFLQKGIPVISVDCKKKEKIGNFKNNGREWQKAGEATQVNVYDFFNLAEGKAIPYGIYEVNTNKGFVNVGVDHDTAEFAVQSIRMWWEHIGKKRYPRATELAIRSDSGGSNGKRNRLWKYCLQQFANTENLTIHVSHLPVGTSKWNAIEHKLFSFISINWRGKPLTSLETVIRLISNTKTKKGLTVEVVADTQSYQTKKKISDTLFNTLHIIRDTFRGDLNYTIAPNL